VSKLLQRLRDAKRAGVYRASSARPIEEATRASGLDVVAIDAPQGELFPSIARALEFPSWFGANWDALEDCLGDLSWRPGEGHVLLFQRPPAGEALNRLIDVLRSSARYWASRGKPFFAVFIDPQRKLELPDLYRGA
jgi:hypothetical protein